MAVPQPIPRISPTQTDPEAPVPTTYPKALINIIPSSAILTTPERSE